MITKILRVLSLLILFNGLLPAVATAKEAAASLGYRLIETGFNPVLTEFWDARAISVKRGQPYDESKDPALRKGTENWEQEQGSFFAIPALVLGIVGVFLFFNRK